MKVDLVDQLLEIPDAVDENEHEDIDVADETVADEHLPDV